MLSLWYIVLSTENPISMPHITSGDVRHVAKLARLSLTDEEIEHYADQLSAVFAYIDMLRDVETEGVPETCQVTGLEDVYREDIVEDCDEYTRRQIIEQFPDRQGNLLRVKNVFE